MHLGFYYHIPVYGKNGELYLPGFLAVFINELAKEVAVLTLIMHQAQGVEIKSADHKIEGKNIRWVNLGKKTPAWHRAIFHKRILERALKDAETCDAIIVRSPTPLAPYFRKYLIKPSLWFMIVGDYVEGAEHLKISTFRDRIIYLYLLYNDYFFTREVKKTDVLVNSPALYKKYSLIAKSIHQIRTTTISNNDFFEREDTCRGKHIELLYTGRIDPAKGLFELIEATALVKKEGYPVRLNVVGWENDPAKPIETRLIERAKELKIIQDTIFHGKKKLGEELNVMYRKADIYVIPSYHEGFPRTIWEAMANSVPVIATAVGGIPEYLTNRLDAVLISPRNVEEIKSSIIELISNMALRQSIIREARTAVKESALEFQVQKLISILTSNNQ